jgi:hypothetical protein
MQNRIGFIPKSYPQPDYYKNCFDAWCAVYIHPRTDEEYHIQLVLDHADRECKAVRYAEILKQTPSFRTPMSCDKFLTLKSAVERMEKILQ